MNTGQGAAAGVCRGEVEGLLLGDGERGQSDQVPHQGGQPAARRDDDHRGGERPGGGVHRRAATRGGLDPRDRQAESHLGAPGRGEPEHGGHGAVRVEHPRFRVKQDRPGALEGQARPAFGGFGRAEQLGRDAVGGEDGVQAARVPPRAEVQAAGDLKQRLPRLLLQPPPPLARDAGKPDVQRIRVGPAEDPGTAVRAAPPVPWPERLKQHDRQAPRGCRPGGGRSGEAGADDDQVRRAGPRAGGARSRRAGLAGGLGGGDNRDAGPVQPQAQFAGQAAGQSAHLVEHHGLGAARPGHSRDRAGR